MRPCSARSLVFRRTLLPLALLLTACGSTESAESNPCLPPTTGQISSFEDGLAIDDGGGLSGSFFVYPGDQLKASISEGALHVAGTVSDYSGIGISFSNCVDASGYSGLEFEMEGRAGRQNRIQLAVNTRENDPKPPVTPLGTCMPANPDEPYADCLPNRTEIDVPVARAQVSVPFSALSEGVPHSAVDPSQIVWISFWLDWSPGQQYEVDLVLDHLRFVH